MARVFDNTDASRSAKKSGLKTIRAKLGLLNSALHATYGLKFKAMDKHSRHYHLVGSFDNNDSPELPPYQTGKEIYWENGEDIWYGYSKLPLDELLMKNLLEKKQTKDTPSSNVNTVPIVKDIQYRVSRNLLWNCIILEFTELGHTYFKMGPSSNFLYNNSEEDPITEICLMCFIYIFKNSVIQLKNIFLLTFQQIIQRGFLMLQISS